ncbi:MAG: diaminopimelate epimerase [Christensenellaceae bacterium]|nr:diaminopimelate epimerase [Christensenellaceae bacterium]
MQFVKMHGLGNDYIYVNGFEEHVEDPAELSCLISDRHFGVGSDGLIIIAPSDVADFKMLMWNSDGSEGKMCGNGIRCVGKYVYETGMTDKTFLHIETGAGIKRLWLQACGNRVSSVQVDMGQPIFDPEKIPVKLSPDEVKNYTLSTDVGDFKISCVSMGNPHCIIFVDDPADVDVDTLGKAIQENPIFPDRTNVEFVSVVNKNLLKMRVYERGAGETLACGTGACASLVAAVQNGLCDTQVDIKLLGGTLHVEWCLPDNLVYMTGPAEFVCSGTWPFPEEKLIERNDIECPISADITLSSNI